MDRCLCHCRRCGEGGQMVSQTTYKRHSNRTDTARLIVPPPPPSFDTPPIPADTTTGGDNTDLPSSDAPLGPVLGFQIPRVHMIDHIRQMLSRKRAGFDFPSSLVFAAPPTKDSNRYPSRTISHLLIPNSYHPLSLVDNDSAAVISYEYLLVEHLDVLNSLPLQTEYGSAFEVETLRNEILETLQYLDRRKGDEWNKQLRVQLNPGTFIISGRDQRTPWLRTN